MTDWNLPHTVELTDNKGWYTLYCSECCHTFDCDSIEEGNEWARGHKCDAPEEPGMDGGPSTAGYRQAMKDAGRGGMVR